MILNIALLVFVTLERIGELWLSNRNTRRLVSRGAREAGSAHYPVMIAIHVLWLAALWWFAPWRQVDAFWLAIFILLELARIWVVTTLGERWTTRIIVLPGAPLVRAGPYRWVNHPNYIIVVGEIAALPLTFGLWKVALIFSILNAAILTVRIRAENRALHA